MIPKILHGTRIFQDLFGVGCTGTNLRTIKRGRTTSNREGRVSLFRGGFGLVGGSETIPIPFSPLFGPRFTRSRSPG
jgi:hypothetical protein